MSLLYNQLLSYDAPSITYIGNIGVSPTSILNPIQIGNLNITSLATQNASNSTTIGVISYDFSPSGQITGVISYDLAPSGQITMEVTSSPGTAILTLQQI
jgi:hypothetical protein